MLINSPVKPLTLGKTVAGNAPMDGEDAIAAKEALWRTGDYKPPFGAINPIPERELISGIRKFQTRYGLKPDGEMQPGGPTERLLRASIGQSPDRLGAEKLKTVPISASVGANARNLPQDRKALKTMLTLTGQFDAESPPEDEDFYLGAAIRNLQSEFGLPRTSTLFPGDETEKALRKSLALHADGDPHDTHGKPLSELKAEQQQLAMAGSGTEWALREAGKSVAGAVDDAKKAAGDALQTNKENDVSKETGKDREDDSHTDTSSQNSSVLPDGMEWWQEQGLHDKGVATIRANGPIKIDEINSSLHIDGVRYTVDWIPLDKDGNPQTIVRNELRENGGHLYPLQINSAEYEPPYDNPDGWEVRVNVPLTEPVNDNTLRPYLNIHIAKPSKRE